MAQSRPKLFYRENQQHNLGRNCSTAKINSTISANIVLLRKLTAQSRPTLFYCENQQHNLGRDCSTAKINSSISANIVLLRKSTGQSLPTLFYCENQQDNLGRHCSTAKINSTISANIVLLRKSTAQSRPKLCYINYFHFIPCSNRIIAPILSNSLQTEVCFSCKFLPFLTEKYAKLLKIMLNNH